MCIEKNWKIFLKVSLFLLLALYFPLTGSDCSSNNIIGGTPGEIYGSWNLTDMKGYLQDVCDSEKVTFDTNGTATLQCPNLNPIVRNYAVANNILSYTETGVQYDITTLTTSTLVLTGRNVGRTLTYTRISADDTFIRSRGNSNTGNNSSELQKGFNERKR